MGIIQTDQWLQQEFNQPTRVCERLTPYFKGQKGREIYHQLIRYGMFQPSRASRNTFEKMVSNHTWAKIEEIYNLYTEKWSGTKIPVFLFPINQNSGFFRKDDQRKSGVSFTDKMFLFLSADMDLKEIEALFVHEYHHVCRLNMLKGNLDDYTLLDSIIIEGLAEQAVLKNCGKKYLAEWCNLYTEKQIVQFWERFFKNHLYVKKTEKLHDDLLYGHGRFPRLAGYATGFSIVHEYYQTHPYSTKKSFALRAKDLIDGTSYQLKE
jgi:uncharacterized protein YjaZ